MRGKFGNGSRISDPGFKNWRKMVGAVRFELTTSCTRNKRASQTTLRPDNWFDMLPRPHNNAIGNLGCDGKWRILTLPPISMKRLERGSVTRRSFRPGNAYSNECERLEVGALLRGL